MRSKKKTSFCVPLVSMDRKRKGKCKLSHRNRVAIFNKWIAPMARWLDLEIFVSPVKKGDAVYRPIWDSVPKKYSVSNAEYITEVGSRGIFLSADPYDAGAPDEFYPYSDIGERIFLSEKEVENWIAKYGKKYPGLYF